MEWAVWAEWTWKVRLNRDKLRAGCLHCSLIFIATSAGAALMKQMGDMKGMAGGADDGDDDDDDDLDDLPDLEES